MVSNDEGLTKTYNRFHDPYEHDPDIERLRELHAEMDRAVLHAYGWDDIPTECEFLLDYEIDEEEWGNKRKPYRYRWPDEVRDEVLARLIALNGERAAEEQRSGAAASREARPAGAPEAAAAACRSSEELSADGTATRSRPGDRARGARAPHRGARARPRRAAWPGHDLERRGLPGWVRPSNWYLTGFLIPVDAPAEESADDDADDDARRGAGERGPAEENARGAHHGQEGLLPLVLGLSTLVAAAAERRSRSLSAGAITSTSAASSDGEADGGDEAAKAAGGLAANPARARARACRLASSSEPPSRFPCPIGRARAAACSSARCRERRTRWARSRPGTRSVSLFLVNRRTPASRSARSGATSSARARGRLRHALRPAS